MNIIEANYTWSGDLSKRAYTKYIILHHSAGTGSASDIHRSHQNNGWAGIGYNFYVRKNGSIYRGRPLDAVGAHTVGYNSESVGICFEGNTETGTMPEAQINAGRELVNYLKKIYPDALIKKHSDFSSTACPGKNFPFSRIANYTKAGSELISINDIVWELAERGIITDKPLWLKKLAEDENAYWLARKTANMTVNKQEAV